MNRIGNTAAFLCLGLWGAWTCASEPSGKERTPPPHVWRGVQPAEGLD